MSAKFGDLPIDTLNVITTYLTIWDMQQFRQASRMFNQIYDEFYLPYENEKLKNNDYIKNQMKIYIYFNQQNIAKYNKSHPYSLRYDTMKLFECEGKCYKTFNLKPYIQITDIKYNFYIKCHKCNKKFLRSHFECYNKYKNIYLCRYCIRDDIYKICKNYDKYMDGKAFTRIGLCINTIIENLNNLSCIKKYILPRLRYNEKKSNELYNEIINFLDSL